MNSKLKNKINSGQLTLGSWITLGHPAIAEIFSNSGFDWIVVDLEHSSMSIDQAGELIRVIDLSDVAPLVRLTSNNPDQIKRVMDAGAHGIVVPMVNSVSDALDAISATRYEPFGNRGVGLARAQSYGAKFKEYVDWQNNSPVVIVQIEHISAIENLKEIFKIKEVDGYIIGPYDLSCSMGIPGEFDDPKFIETMQTIKDFGDTANKPGGLHIVEPDKSQLVKSISDGYKFIAYSVDIRMLDNACRIGLDGIIDQ
jgi:2-dehydro-3-deoxyglucarate aldolase